METQLTELVVGMVFLSPAILAAVESIKRLGVPAQYMPFVAAAIGALVVPFLADAPLAIEILAGVLTGFSAVGVYEGAKQTSRISSGK